MQQTLPGTVPVMTDTRFMSAKEKQKVLRHWASFLASGLTWEKFTKLLYHHLTQHCSFIAHYDRERFYQHYFTSGDQKVHFLSQFDNSQGDPRSIEYGGHWWLDGDYEDINRVMCDVAAHYIPDLVNRAKEEQRRHDLAVAAMLLERHGIDLIELMMKK